MGRALRWLGLGAAARVAVACLVAVAGEDVWFFRIDPRPAA